MQGVEPPVRDAGVGETGLSLEAGQKPEGTNSGGTKMPHEPPTKGQGVSEKMPPLFAPLEYQGWTNKKNKEAPQS